jgi:hypothetical protein
MQNFWVESLGKGILGEIVWMNYRVKGNVKRFFRFESLVKGILGEIVWLNYRVKGKRRRLPA